MWSSKKIFDYSIYILLFLFGIAFLNKQTYLIVFAAIIVFLGAKKGWQISGSISFLFLFFFSTFCILFGSIESPTLGLKSLCCIAAFYIGNKLNYKKNGSLKKLVLFLAFSFALYPILNLLYEFYLFGFSFSFLNSVTHYDIWSNDASAVTLIASNFCMIASLFGFFVFYSKNKILVFLGSLIIGLACFYNLIMGGRTFFLILIIMFAIGMVLTMILKKKGFKWIIKRLLSVAIIICLMIFLLTIVSKDFKTTFLGFFEQTHFFNRFGDVNNASDFLKTSRLDIRNSYLALFWKYPLGGRSIFKEVGMLAHELWLDVYDIGGIFAWVPFMLYFGLSIIHIAKFCLNRFIDVESRLIVFCCSLGLIMQFAVEPLFSGNPALLFAYCLIDGAVINYSNNNYVKFQHYSSLAQYEKSVAR